MYVVYIPYKVGERYYICFEIGWECLVLSYAMVGTLLLFGKMKDEYGDPQLQGFIIGIFDVVGRTGFYNIFKYCMDEDYLSAIGGGLGSGSQLKAIQQYKKDGSNGYQQVKGMVIYA